MSVHQSASTGLLQPGACPTVITVILLQFGYWTLTVSPSDSITVVIEKALALLVAPATMCYVFDGAYGGALCIALRLSQVSQFGAFDICKCLHCNAPWAIAVAIDLSRSSNKVQCSFGTIAVFTLTFCIAVFTNAIRSAFLALASIATFQANTALRTLISNAFVGTAITFTRFATSSPLALWAALSSWTMLTTRSLLASSATRTSRTVGGTCFSLTMIATKLSLTAGSTSLQVLRRWTTHKWQLKRIEKTWSKNVTKINMHSFWGGMGKQTWPLRHTWNRSQIPDLGAMAKAHSPQRPHHEAGHQDGHPICQATIRVAGIFFTCSLKNLTSRHWKASLQTVAFFWRLQLSQLLLITAMISVFCIWRHESTFHLCKKRWDFQHRAFFWGAGPRWEIYL